MSAKKKAEPKANKTITFGKFKGCKCSITRKKASEGNVVVNIVDGPCIEIHKDFIQ